MGGGPWRITFVTNPDDCNLGCAMCDCGVGAPAPGEQGRRPRPRRLEPARVLAVLDERQGSALREVIPSTMGEPLLWDGLDLIVDRCAVRGLALNLTTNGTWPGRGPARWAARLLPVASDVKVSWNGATPATAAAIMSGIDLGRAIDDLRIVVEHRDAIGRWTGSRPTITLQVTAQERNVAELPELVRLAASLGVDRVKVNQLQVRFPSLAEHSLRRSPEAISRWNRAVALMHAAAGQVRTPDGRRVELQNAVELPSDPSARLPPGPCPFVGVEAWVLVDGRFAPCPHPAASRGELGEFGSLQDRTLGAFWRGEPLRALAEGYERHTVCVECPFRRPGGA